MLTLPRRLAAATLLAAVLLIGAQSSQAAPGPAADPRAGRPEQAVLLAPDLAPEPDAAQLADLGSIYLSPVTAAEAPFTHMLLRWEAFEPISDTLTLELRASPDGEDWSPWGLVPENPDLWVPADGDQVYWSQEIYAGEGARFWQLRANLAPAPDGRLPELRRVEVNTVDARFGPPDPQPAADPSLATVGRPPVVSRTAWGNPDGQSSRARPVYYPVNHMVVHHTADANSLRGGEQSWADRVRAIWSFHTFTRGWGDIGYNYLVDPSGVVYEGRAGGDDAVAFHDTANYGSMGVVLIGTYASADPSGAAQASLVDLLAWKAAQKRIDPLGRSFYYGCSISRYCGPFNAGATVANIAAHRHVTPGHTSCPGDRLEALLPGIRQRVQARLNGSGSPGDDGDLLIDELEVSFARSAATWYDLGCGYGGHSFYTFATDSQAESTNVASWRPNLPGAGRYRVLVHIPSDCGLAAVTSAARYRIHTAEGVREVTLDQSRLAGWVDLGSFSFAAGQSGYVELSDLTGEPYSQRRAVLFDSVRWVADDSSAGRLELLDVRYDRDVVPAGELLKVTFVVRNSSAVTILSQEPEAGTRPDAAASFDLANSYVYDEGECFLGAPGQSYPAYPKDAGRFRVMLGASNRSVACSGNDGGYPWRWGLNGPLGPGQTRELVGYVRFRQPGTVSLRAGAINEYVAYMATDAFARQITVVPEAQSPAPASYDQRLQPLAQVYRLGDIPDNLLARTRNPLSILKGAYVGSFAWQGELLSWGEGGPLPGLSDGFIIEQTRVVVAPVAGEYRFRVTSDDGAWLWVNGALVVDNAGLHGAAEAEGSVRLAAGRHVLSFRYFERSGEAVAGYAVQPPGGAGFGQPLDGLGGAGARVDQRLGATFPSLSGLTLAADDLGGAGVATLLVSVNGGAWSELPGAIWSMGALRDGSYTLRYRAVDAAGNSSAEGQISFRVDSEVSIRDLYLPLVQR